MSLKSVVKSEVKLPDSEEYSKSKKKHHKADREDSSDERRRIRERGDAKDSAVKMKRKHSEERSESEESDEPRTRDSARKVQKHIRQESYESDERYSSEDRWKGVKKDRKGEARDRKKFRNDDDHEDSRGKELDQREYDEQSRHRDDDRYHRDYDRSRQDDKRSHREGDRSRQRGERLSRDRDRSRQDDERSRKDEQSHKDDERLRKDDERSHKDGERSRKDDERSHKDDWRSRQDGDRSSRNGDRLRQDTERSRRDDRSRQQGDRSHRYNDHPRHDDARSERIDNRQRRDFESSDRKDEKSVDASDPKDTNRSDDAENYLAGKRAKPSAEGDLMTRTGGAYIPPARLRMMQAQITDKSSAQYQRIAWEALKKSINGLINKVNVSNIGMIVLELLQENIVRGRGLLARSIMQAQAASPTFTHVYAALVAIINTKFPNIGELIVKRLIVSFKKGFRRNEKATCLSSLRFMAHLFNQLVCHEVLALQVLMLLVSQPTDDSVEVAVGFLKECGKKLKELSPKSLNAVFESLRTVLHEATIDKRVQYMIEVMFAIRKDGFKDHPSVIEELDLVEEDDQYTHVLKLDDPDLDPEDGLNVFKFDPQYLENEEKYKAIKREHLDEGDSDDEDADDDASGEGDEEDEGDDDDEDGGDGDGKGKTVIIDNTETNLVAFRRTLYLTIQSSLDFEECAHKIRKMEIKPGQEDELCNMILDCCAQQRTYEKFFGLLAQRFCMMEKKFLEPFQKIFQEQYDTVHRLETNKLRNVAKFFSHLLHTDAIDWKVLECIRLNEEDTTSSGRIFIKILFQELSEFMGLSKLNDRLKDVTLQQHFEGLFPRDNPRNTRFAINFFTSIGLGGLTDELRDHLKSVPKQPYKSPTPVESSSSESSSSEDESESSSSDSSASSSSSDSEPSPAKKRRRKQPSETPEKSQKRRSKHSQKSEKSLAPAKSSHKSEGPTSMQLRLMKLASYGQVPEDKDSEADKEKVRGRDEDTRARDRGRDTHPRRNDDGQGHHRGQKSDSESVIEKEQQKRNRKLDEDRRRNKEDSKKRQTDKRTYEEDSESDQGRKHKGRKHAEDSSSDKDRERKGRRNNEEDRGREQSRDKSREKRRRRSRS